MLNKVFKKQASFIAAVFAVAIIFSLAFVLSQNIANAAAGDPCNVASDCGAGFVCSAGTCVVNSNSNSGNLDPWGGNSGITADSLQTQTGLGNEDPRTIAANVINIILGFLGIIAVILILVGGFRWMMAQGNEDAIASAKSLMVAGVVGLLIILAAFGIARFVIDALVNATA